MIGATERHGPHQGAQKSTSTGTLLFRMSPSKLASDTWETFSLDIKKLLRPQSTRRSPEGIQAPETRILPETIPSTPGPPKWEFFSGCGRGLSPAHGRDPRGGTTAPSGSTGPGRSTQAHRRGAPP